MLKLETRKGSPQGLGAYKLILVLILIVALGMIGYYLLRQYREGAPTPLAEDEVVSEEEVSEEEESAFETEVGVEIPEGADKTKLSPVEGKTGQGIATRKWEDNKYKHSVIASLPDLEEGKFYQGWLVKDDELLPTAKFDKKKGGWMMEYEDDEDRLVYQKVLITQESKDDDQPEESVLEGEF